MEKNVIIFGVFDQPNFMQQSQLPMYLDFSKVFYITLDQLLL